MATGPIMPYERSRPLVAEREEIGLTPSEARRLAALCSDLIDLCAKATGRIDPAVRSIVGYARDEALRGRPKKLV
jgi:hypothetical protein